VHSGGVARYDACADPGRVQQESSVRKAAAEGEIALMLLAWHEDEKVGRVYRPIPLAISGLM
jgi:hypothetical protein